MAQDYDAPRVREEDEPENESLEALKKQRSESIQAALIDVDDNDTADGIDWPVGRGTADSCGSGSAGRVRLYVLLPGSPP